MTFDGTISLGNVIAIAVFIIGLAGTYGRLASQLGSIQTKVDAMWHSFLRKP